MEFGKNLHFSCRVCAVNVEKRRSSLALVPIFTTPTLAENLRKHLNISVAYGDGLPEKVCKNCFKRLESFHNFACLAKKTENFFKEFLKTTKTNSVQSMEKYGIHFQPEPLPVSLHRADDPLIGKIASGKKEAEQVVLNFTLNNPLTRDIESKITKAREATNLKHRNSNDQVIIPNQTLVASEISTETIDNGMDAVHKKINADQKQKYLKMVLNNKNTAPQPLPYMTEIPAGVSQMFQTNSSPPRVPISTPTNLFSQEMQQQMAQTLKKGAVIYDCLNLGSVIKDIDLLKLILKALKWSYTPATLGETLQKLKDTRFRDVILDKNLLQDTDMMQILNTYLSPILLQTQSTPAPLPTIVSYNIPADTSVHIVSVPHDEPAEQINQPRRHSSSRVAENFQNQSQRQSNADYRQRHYQRHSLPPTILRRRRRLKTKAPSQVINSDGPIIVSDDDSDTNAETFEVSIDPTIYFPQYGETQEKQWISRQRQNHKKMMRKESIAADKRRNTEINKNRKHLADKPMVVEKDPLEADEQDPLQTDEILIIDSSNMSVPLDENLEKLKKEDNSNKDHHKRRSTNGTGKDPLLTPIDTPTICEKSTNIPATIRKNNIPSIKTNSTSLKAHNRPTNFKTNHVAAVAAPPAAIKPTATSTDDLEEITVNGINTPPVAHIEMPIISAQATPTSRDKILPKQRTIDSTDVPATSPTPTLPVAASQTTPGIPTISRVTSVIVPRPSNASNAHSAQPSKQTTTQSSKQIATQSNHRITALINSHNRSITPGSPKTNEDGDTIAEAINEDSETITIEDDDDDAVWADFKVVDSPEYIGPDDPITFIKPFIVKKEEEEDEATEESKTECDPSLVKVESNHVETEIVQEEDSKEGIKDEKLEAIDSGTITSPPERRRGRRRKITTEDNSSAENTNKTLPQATTETRQSKRKSAVVSYSPPTKKPSVTRVTRAPKVEKEILQRKSKTTSKYYNTPEPKVERDVKQRKRICKQCGFTFDNLVKFMEHRKKFHN